MNLLAIISLIANVIYLALYGVLILVLMATATGKLPYWAPPLVVIGVFIAMAIVKTAGNQARQLTRDLAAEEVANAIARGEPIDIPVGLFLRSFSTDDAFAYGLSKRSWLDPSRTLSEENARSMSFERFLIHKFGKANKRLVPIAIGRRGEDYGFGKIVTDDASWQDLVRKLINRADLIFLVVGATSGTMWEVEHILDSASLSKTVFVASPTRLLKDQSKTAVQNLKEGYALAARHLQAFSLSPPDYRDGLAFRFEAKGAPCSTYNLFEGKVDKVLRSIIDTSRRESPTS